LTDVSLRPRLAKPFLTGSFPSLLHTEIAYRTLTGPCVPGLASRAPAKILCKELAISADAKI